MNILTKLFLLFVVLISIFLLPLNTQACSLLPRSQLYLGGVGPIPFIVCILALLCIFVLSIVWYRKHILYKKTLIGLFIILLFSVAVFTMNWRSFGTLGSGDGGCPPDLGDVVSRNLLEKDIIEKICLDGNYRVPPEIEVWRDWRGIARVFDKHPSILENRSHISVSTYNEKGEFVLSLDDRPYEPELHDDIIEQKARLTKRLNLDDNIIKCEENPAH